MDLCNTAHLERARVRHQKACEHDDTQHLHKRCGRPSSTPATASTSGSTQYDTLRFTRSSSTPFNRDLCFFCQEVTKEIVHVVSTFNAGKQLKKAVEEGSNHKWKVQLSAAISADDAHAIDVKYHLPCWVQNVQRAPKSGTSSDDKEHTLQETNISKIAADIEFVSLVRSLLQAGEILNMTDLKSVYSRILDNNGVHNVPLPTTQGMKEKINSHIDDVHFMKAKRRNESDRVFSTAVRDAAVEDAMTKTNENNVQQLFESASVLRSTIDCQNKYPWQFEGELNTDDAEKHVPKALYAFLRWLLEGPATSIEPETMRSATIHRDVLTISQNIMYGYKSKRQVMYKPKEPDAPFRHRLEWPQQLAVAIAVHQSTRSKKLLDFLHGFGLSVDYSRILRLETQLANSVIESKTEQGAYFPRTMRIGTFVFFALENSDFNEDTPDGKRTLHATACALYQRRDHAPSTDEHRTLTLHDRKARDRSLKVLTAPDFVPCQAPNKQSATGTTYSFKTRSTPDVTKPYLATDTVWLLSRTIMRTAEAEDVQDDIIPPDDQLQAAEPQHADPVASLVHEPKQPPGSRIKHHDIPTWTAYNSLLSSSKPLTEVTALPLVAAPAHEWQTLITVLKQTQQINSMVLGPDRKTVITLDMALYERAKQLEMTRDDCKGKWVLRLGEMHTVMAALRAAGNAVEDSGLDEAWSEADIYGPTTTRQILEAKHMKRTLEAHITTVQALFDLYVDEFFQEHPHLRSPCTQSAQQVAQSCHLHNRDEMTSAQNNMLAVLESNEVLKPWQSLMIGKKPRVHCSCLCDATCG